MRNSWSWSSNDDIGCGTVILVVLLVLALCFVINPLLVMWLWNWIAVKLFAAPVIGFWQAFGLHWLCTLLFGSTRVIRSKS